MKKIATLGYRIKWIFFATSHGKSPCDRICGSVKYHSGKRSLQRPMNSQILDHKAMLNVCKEEMSQKKLSGISKGTMGGVYKSFVEWYSRGNTVPGTQSSHHFIPLSSSKIAHKLSSENESHDDTHDFNLPTTFQLCDIRPMTYVTCLYDSFWWVGLVTQVDVEQGDVRVNFCSHMGHVKHLIDQKLKVHAMCQPKTFFVRYLLPQQLDELIR